LKYSFFNFGDIAMIVALTLPSMTGQHGKHLAASHTFMTAMSAPSFQALVHKPTPCTCSGASSFTFLHAAKMHTSAHPAPLAATHFRTSHPSTTSSATSLACQLQFGHPPRSYSTPNNIASLPAAVSTCGLRQLVVQGVVASDQLYTDKLCARHMVSFLS
jgi:hypothetical protein